MAQPGAVPPVLGQDARIKNPANKALIALGLLTVLPSVVIVNTNANIVITASLCVFAGCWKSVKATPPEDSMSRKDAMKFPLIGSAVLLSLFLLFKFLPQHLINLVLTGYFVFIGIFAITVTIAPFFAAILSESTAKKEYQLPRIRIPGVFDEPLIASISIPEIIAGIPSTGFCVWYFFSKHWLANNVLGLAFAVQGIEHISLGATVTGCILLGGLFFYDIFWVFFTPVMVSVAKSFDAPIKLLFPRVSDGEALKQPFSMLGLGDIVIPGIFVALLLRYDVLQKFRTHYFYSTFGGYVIGLATTIAIMHIFKAAQPALLYIVPAVIGALALHAALRREFTEVFGFSEAPQEEEGKDEGLGTQNKNGKEPVGVSTEPVTASTKKSR